MKAYQYQLARLYKHGNGVFRFSSASLFQSLLSASVIGVVAAFLGIALHALGSYESASPYVSVMIGAIIDMVIVTALVTVLLEQQRKRSIRRTLELAFLNHHIRNAITQMGMVQYVSDPGQQERLKRQAVSRVSEALFRIANSADLTGLSLEVDLQGLQLTHEGEEREKQGTDEKGRVA